MTYSTTSAVTPAPRRVQLRLESVRAAIEIARPIEECFGTDAVLELADQVYAWLIRPVTLALTFGPVALRSTGEFVHPTYRHYFTGAFYMSNLQLGDTQQVTATAVALDADGNPTSDTLSWSASVATAVSLTPSADTMTCVIGGLVPTTGVVITATDTHGNTTTGDLDVVAGPATSLTLQFGPVTDRAAATSTTSPSTTGSSATATGSTTAAPASGTAATTTTAP